MQGFVASARSSFLFVTGVMRGGCIDFSLDFTCELKLLSLKTVGML